MTTIIATLKKEDVNKDHTIIKIEINITKIKTVVQHIKEPSLHQEDLIVI
jgi:hypothetical protein